MTSFSYDRRYELIVSQPFAEADTSGEFLSSPLENDYSLNRVAEDFRKVKKLRSVEITELHFTCDINRTSKSGSNEDSATIKVYNLNSDNQSIVQNIGNYVILNAGYAVDREIPMIYSGQISDAYTEKEGEDVVTTLVCKDGFVPLNSVRVSYRKPKGSTYKSVILDLVDIFKANGVQAGELILDPPSLSPFRLDQFASTITLTKGWTYMGYARDALQEICEAISYEWKIINNAIYIYPRGYTNVSTTVKLSPNNIISVAPQRNGSKSTSSSTTSEQQGLQVVCLLEGGANKAAKLEIMSGKYKGTYRIESVTHNLSYEGQQWNTTLDVLKT